MRPLMRQTVAGLAFLLAAWTGPLGTCDCAHAAPLPRPAAKPAAHACCAPAARTPAGSAETHAPAHGPGCSHCEATEGSLGAPSVSMGAAESASRSVSAPYASALSTAILDGAAPSPSPPRYGPFVRPSRRTLLAAICPLRI